MTAMGAGRPPAAPISGPAAPMPKPEKGSILELGFL
jgi:hypothetical protein